MKQGRLQFWILAIFTLVGGMISAPSGYAKAKADVEIAEQFDSDKQVHQGQLIAKKLPTFEIQKFAYDCIIAFVSSELDLQRLHNQKNIHQIIQQEFQADRFQHLLYSPSQFKNFSQSKDSATS